MSADLEEILTIVNLLLEDVAEKPDRLVRAQEIARRDIGATTALKDLRRLREIAASLISAAVNELGRT